MMLLIKYDEQVMSPSEITFLTQPATKDTNVLTEYVEKIAPLLPVVTLFYDTTVFNSL